MKLSSWLACLASFAVPLGATSACGQGGAAVDASASEDAADAADDDDDAAMTPAPEPPGFTMADAACRLCVANEIEGGFCRQAFVVCESRAGCLEYVECVEQCPEGSSYVDCIQACGSAASQEVRVEAAAYLFCACCRSSCTQSCGDRCATYRNTLVGPVGAGCFFGGFPAASGACNRCLDQELGGGACSQQNSACVNNPGCREYTRCAGDCVGSAGFSSCIDSCAAEAGAASTDLARDYFACPCCGPCALACDDECAPYEAGGGPIAGQCGG